MSWRGVCLAALVALAAAGGAGCAHRLHREREPRLQPARGPEETRRSGLVVHTRTVTPKFP